MVTRILTIGLSSAAALSLGACATYSSPREDISYLPVPCSTPGAFAADADYPIDKGPGKADPQPDENYPPETGPPPPEATAPATCLVAVSTPRSSYGSGYYDPYYGRYGGYGYGRYGYPFFGSIGVFGGHGTGHHGGGGHGSGSDHGGGHIGGHDGGHAGGHFGGHAGGHGGHGGH